VAAGRLLAPLVERAEKEMDAQPASQLGEAGAGLAVERLGAPHLLLVRSQIVGVLRRGHELRAVPGSALDQRADALPVGLLVGGRGELDGGGEKHQAPCSTLLTSP